MQPLIDHARGFAGAVAGRRDEFARLGDGQKPEALFISCSDSRVMPALITGAQPGQLFELRNAGNIVPPHRSDASCAVAGTVEFAVRALGVSDIVVCGHSHCGAVQGLLNQSGLSVMPQVRRWLTQAGHGTGHSEVDLDAAVMRHVRTQLDHVRTHPCVVEGVAAGTLRLHAWFYRVTTGEVLANEPGTPNFLPL
ncbi:carbonic anhydrase [Kibdelosporangium phytohabitans]|uniref:Carbonic anhydrase n=1 Tax=Kibdelosporangium phytohabitans TaxID=860235 RepID=A0A0N7F5V8_9PSEU|nr:carbonic anhydrase [Kibdelosporangium phytohabitans]ALG15311.1 carbonic anhydrase [Kibdelosporangium phytohabitans]MBE1462847.1 carbonic anhydrase [Kibdelosporangium phytohabitans]